MFNIDMIINSLKNFSFSNNIFKGNTIGQQTKTSTALPLDISLIANNYRNKIDVVVTDIDGTISVSDDVLTNEVLRSFDKLQDKNIPVILSTSRCYSDTLPIIRQMSSFPCYTIALQGGCIVDNNEKILKNLTTSTQSTKELISWFNEIKHNNKDIHLVVYFDDQPYCEDDIQFWWKSQCKIKHTKSIADLLKQGKRMQKALIYQHIDKYSDSTNNKVINGFNSNNFEELCLKKSSDGIWDIQNKFITKDRAVAQVLHELNINPANAMAIGDSMNDIEMLNYIKNQNGLSVAMGNAPSGILQYVNAVTDDVNKNGFSKVIDYIF